MTSSAKSSNAAKSTLCLMEEDIQDGGDLSLSAKKKLGFINVACKSPDLKFAEYEQWSCDIVDCVIYSKTAKEVWDSLKQIFGKSNGANLSPAKGTIRSNTRKTKLTKSLEDQRLIQFLGLNDVYAQERENILMMSPLPSMDGAYSLLLQDENLREVYANAHFTSDSASFIVAEQGKQPNAQLLAEFAAFMAT
ncbi:uncharacterized protein LOC142172626 [Nicotiana tabacum]|uniref:Uncharacterized protein LOC142172626 n=1 Tax=Nicotiana tabacum TaxID=4097 RepID=A0AC58T585_TOBAC